jgi:hypothetical protein
VEVARLHRSPRLPWEADAQDAGEGGKLPGHGPQQGLSASHVGSVRASITRPPSSPRLAASSRRCTTSPAHDHELGCPMCQGCVHHAAWSNCLGGSARRRRRPSLVSARDPTSRQTEGRPRAREPTRSLEAKPTTCQASSVPRRALPGKLDELDFHVNRRPKSRRRCAEAVILDDSRVPDHGGDVAQTEPRVRTAPSSAMPVSAAAALPAGVRVGLPMNPAQPSRLAARGCWSRRRPAHCSDNTTCC